MSKHFEEARLVITADIVYDPDGINLNINEELLIDIEKLFSEYCFIFKNTKVELEGFICNGK